MPLLLTYNKPLMGIWKTEESPEELLSLLTNETDYLQEISTMRTENRKKEWLAVRVLLKELLGEEARIAYHTNGAPYLPEKNLHISISHTKGYVAVALSPDSPVGIDIEYISDRIMKVRERFLSEEENNAIDAMHEREHLLIYWCAKETMFKMIKEEGIDFINHLHVNPFPFKREGSFTASETRTSQAVSYIISYRVYDQFVITFSSVSSF